jgi:hypothetical protein
VIAVAVSPTGTTSLTVTVPEVAVAPALRTVIVNVAPTWPWKKLPVCVFVIATSGPPITMTESFDVLLAALTSPPPETVAVLISGELAPFPTSTVSVIAG